MNTLHCGANHSSSFMTFKNFLQPPPPTWARQLKDGKNTKLSQAMIRRHGGMVEVQLHSFSTSSPGRREWSDLCLYRFNSRKQPGKHQLGVLVRPQPLWTNGFGEKKIFARFEPLTVQSVVTCCAHYIIPAPRLWRSGNFFVSLFHLSLFFNATRICGNRVNVTSFTTMR